MRCFSSSTENRCSHKINRELRHHEDHHQHHQQPKLKSHAIFPLLLLSISDDTSLESSRGDSLRKCVSQLANAVAVAVIVRAQQRQGQGPWNSGESISCSQCSVTLASTQLTPSLSLLSALFCCFASLWWW